MVDRTPYTQQKTGQNQNTMTRKEGGNNGGQNTIQSFVVYIVFCPPLYSPSFLVIVC
jgi:hypothetical protein